jgi:hypothetical protein
VRLAIVVPTVDGREADLDRCIAGYAATAPDAKVYVERNYPTCGAAWNAGAAKAELDGFDYLHLTADDLEPHAGWLEVAVETVDKDHIPAPLVYNPDGNLQSAGLAGLGCYTGPHEDWQLIEGTTVPFLTRKMWNAIGMINVHYCTDLWVSVIGRKRGWETAIRTGMVFTHYNSEPGRLYTAMGDTHEYLRLVAEAL